MPRPCIALVTVGTTQFDSLIQGVYSEEIAGQLQRLEISHVILQVGQGSLPFGSIPPDAFWEAPLGDALPPDADTAWHVPASASGTGVAWSHWGIHWLAVRFSPDLPGWLSSMHAVICHAGAGSSFGAARACSRVLLVPNPALQGNHQAELASAFAEAGWAYTCTTAALAHGVTQLAEPCSGEVPPSRADEYAQWIQRALDGAS